MFEEVFWAYITPLIIYIVLTSEHFFSNFFCEEKNLLIDFYRGLRNSAEQHLFGSKI